MNKNFYNCDVIIVSTKLDPDLGSPTIKICSKLLKFSNGLKSFINLKLKYNFS